MFQSLRYSNLFLRFGLSAVFIWLGVDKLINSSYWINAWMPRSIISFSSHLHISAVSLIYLIAIFEILISISLLSNTFVGYFCLLAIIFIVASFFFQGFSEFIIRDIGLVGALLALIFWPNNRRYY